MAPTALVRIADRNAAEVGFDRIVDIAFLDLVELEIVLVDGKPKTRCAIATCHIIVDDEGHLPEDVAQLARDRTAHLGIIAVDLGEQRGDDGRPRRNFDNFHHRALEEYSDLSIARARRGQSYGWCDAVRPWARIDLQITLLRLVAQVGVAHQAVEIEWSGRSDISLECSPTRASL